MNIQAWLQLNLKIEFSVYFFPAPGAWQTQASSDMSQREIHCLRKKKKAKKKKERERERENKQTNNNKKTHGRMTVSYFKNKENSMQWAK